MNTSFLYESKAQYVTDQPDFCNAVCLLRTKLEPPSLLLRLQHIEKQLGRLPSNQRFGPRPLDLDIAMIKEGKKSLIAMKVEIPGPEKGSEIGSLTIPHVRMQEREFVLRPLADLCPNLVHPKLKMTVDEMLEKYVSQQKWYLSSYSTATPPLSRVLPLAKPRTNLQSTLWSFGSTFKYPNPPPPPPPPVPFFPVAAGTASSPPPSPAPVPPSDELNMHVPRYVKIMGILNATPDSFSDGGKDASVQAAVSRALQMVREGAEIIDVGGESTRPGAAVVEAEEELRRVLPLIEGIRAQGQETLISIDTRRASVARAAVEAGADIVNDVSGGNFDEDMFKTVADLGVPYILMHSRGTPQTMSKLANYRENPALDVHKELGERLAAAAKVGLYRWSTFLDPGIGFAKELEHNVALLNNMQVFHGKPLLLGVSRKRFIGTICGVDNPEERDLGTSVINALALVKRGRAPTILRVHNVPAAVQTVKMATTLAPMVRRPKIVKLISHTKTKV